MVRWVEELHVYAP